VKIHDFLKVMVDRGASDIYFAVDSPPMYRVEGVTEAGENEKLTTDVLEELVQSIMSGKQREEFAQTMEMNLALYYPELGRFRVSIFRQRGCPGMVIRQIKVEILSTDQLGLPPILKDITMSKRGLVLVAGATGSGKSTTQAAMVDYRNSNSSGHIITVEDPLEFVHPHKKCVITQREVGFDTHSFQAALRNTLRQAPDVILIGEIRDEETMGAAITFSETGHLCLGTLHSNNANQAIERIMNFFPEVRHPQIYLQLSLNLRAIISQRLIRSVDGTRVAALEILMDTPRIKDLIKERQVDMLKEAMEQGIQEGCQTFDHALFDLYSAGKITLDQALANADSANNLRLKIKLAESQKGEDEAEEKPGFRIQGERPVRDWKRFLSQNRSG